MVWSPILESGSQVFNFISKEDSSAEYPVWVWKRQHAAGRSGTTTKMQMQRRDGSTVVQKGGDDVAVSAGTGYIHSLGNDPDDSTVDFWVNGSDNGTPPGGAVLDPDSDGVLYVGNTDNTDASMRSYLCEMIILDHSTGAVPPSDTNRQQIEGYLAHKWGLEGSLPSGHPYETSPPRISSIFAS
jgi:hypothetical protein